MVHELIEARDERRLLRLQRQLAAYKLLIIDEFGSVPLSTTGAELLFEVFPPLINNRILRLFVPYSRTNSDS
jgi:DNA replication protein DnaC